MAQISVESRKEFEIKSKPYRDKAEEILKKEKEIQLLMNRDSKGISYKKMGLVEDMIHVASLYVGINSLALAIIETKNNEALNDARKILYKAVIYLEEVVSNYVDSPFSEYSEKLESISDISLEKKYAIVRKLGLAIRMVTDAYGENTKWKWSFVELEARYATVSKNLINLKNAIQAYNDPRNSDYHIAVPYLRLIMKLINKSANGYRDKYELSTHRLDDMRLAIQYLLSLRRIQLLLGLTDEGEIIKKKALVWKSKMESDQKNGSSK